MLSGCSEWGGEEKTVSCIGYCRLRFKDCGSNTCTQLMSMDLFAASSEVYKGSRIFPASCFPLEDLSNTFPKFNLCPCRLTDSYFEDRMIPYCRQSKLMDLYHKFLSSSVLHSITGWILCSPASYHTWPNDPVVQISLNNRQRCKNVRCFPLPTHCTICSNRKNNDEEWKLTAKQ